MIFEYQRGVSCTYTHTLTYKHTHTHNRTFCREPNRTLNTPMCAHTAMHRPLHRQTDRRTPCTQDTHGAPSGPDRAPGPTEKPYGLGGLPWPPQTRACGRLHADHCKLCLYSFVTMHKCSISASYSHSRPSKALWPLLSSRLP